MKALPSRKPIPREEQKTQQTNQRSAVTGPKPAKQKRKTVENTVKSGKSKITIDRMGIENK